MQRCHDGAHIHPRHRHLSASHPVYPNLVMGFPRGTSLWDTSRLAGKICGEVDSIACSSSPRFASLLLRHGLLLFLLLILLIVIFIFIFVFSHWIRIIFLILLHGSFVCGLLLVVLLLIWLLGRIRESLPLHARCPM